MKCFFKEHFCVDTVHATLLFIQVGALYQEKTKVGEKDNNGVIPFASQSGSNKLSCSIPEVDVNRSGIRGEEDKILQNETEENHVVGWSSVNLHDGVNDVLPIVDECDMFYNVRNDDVDYDDDTKEEMHEDDIVLDSDIALGNYSRRMIMKSMLHLKFQLR